MLFVDTEQDHETITLIINGMIYRIFFQLTDTIYMLE